MDENITRHHYENIALSYEKLWSYEDAYSIDLVNDIKAFLSIKQGDVIADVGGQEFGLKS